VLIPATTGTPGARRGSAAGRVLRQAVDEDVEQQLEALVRVGVREVTLRGYLVSAKVRER
jgi:hypothetical protein